MTLLSYVLVRFQLRGFIDLTVNHQIFLSRHPHPWRSSLSIPTTQTYPPHSLTGKAIPPVQTGPGRHKRWFDPSSEDYARCIIFLILVPMSPSLSIGDLHARKTENVTNHVMIIVRRSGEGLVIDETCRCLAEVAAGTVPHKLTIVYLLTSSL